MRIGVLGGSFDPVHLGHLVAAEGARDCLELDQVRFVPAGHQPLKGGRHVASAAHRAAMLDAAVADHAAFVVDRRELDRPGPSYSVETLRSLRADLPHDQLFFIVGSDAARDLGAWYDADALPALARLVVVTRPGATPEPGPASSVVTIPGIDISATMVREMVRRGASIRYLVPRGVEDYIRAHGLYRDAD
ncbi:MAG: nicotinate-nucleotide adenylyltransferase [Gemmatimonadetes bacterium]|nr:nicotinate-nucleotide adenylyltransferase [Gemmatimonadota bacterium]